MRSRAWLSRLLTWTLWSFAAHASAEAPRAHLSWSHPAGSMCPSGAVLQSDVEQLIGSKVFVARGDADVLVRGRIESTESGLLAHIEVQDAVGNLLGTRELTAPGSDCAALRRVLSLILTTLLDGPAELSSRVRRRKLVSRFGAAVGLLTGQLPRTTASFGLSYALDYDARLRTRVDATYWLPVTVETSRGLGARLQALGASVALCPRVSRRSELFVVWLCGGGQLGALLASPQRLENAARRPARLSAQAQLEVVLSLQIAPRYELWLGAGLLASLTRPSFYFRRADGSTREVHRPASLGVIFRLGLTIAGS